ncbi:MAG: hypothetical protein H6814_06195 [Phycisphaeraceae bacterium]|nr:hypothetical protein [Phycisphaeraceae bacterium]
MIFILIVFLISYPAHRRWSRLGHNSRQMLASRDSCAPEPWLNDIVDPDNIQEASESLRRLARAMRVNPEKLRPSDRFDDELVGIARNPNGDSDDLDEAFMEECDRLGLDHVVGQRIETIEDYFRELFSVESETGSVSAAVQGLGAENQSHNM